MQPEWKRMKHDSLDFLVIFLYKAIENLNIKTIKMKYCCLTGKNVGR